MVGDFICAHAYELVKELSFLKKIREKQDSGPSTSGSAGLENL